MPDTVPSNGILARLNEGDRRINQIEEDMRDLRKEFPNRDRCNDHRATTEKLVNRVTDIQMELMRRSQIISEEEWKTMHREVANLKMAHWRVGVIVGVILTLGQIIAGAVIVRSVEKTFDQMRIEEQVK